MKNFTIFSGTSNKRLSDAICILTSEKRGIASDLGDLKIEKFKDGEILPTFNESVRGQSIYIIQTTNSSDAIVETLLILDAAKRAGAKEITLITPYFGYSRQDKVDHVRSSIGARVMADSFERGGATRIITLDLHASAIQGFFNIPVIHLNGGKIFTKYIKSLALDNLTIMSPDQGGVKRAENFFKYFPEATFAQINKKRVKPNEIHSMELMGDVKDRNVVIIDDMADTLGTLKNASELIMEHGAKSVRAIATHGILSGRAMENLNKSPLSELIVTDTISYTYDCLQETNKLTVISCANMIAQSIISLEERHSIEELNSNFTD